MAAIGPLVFCTDCGHLLPASRGLKKGRLFCRSCGKVNIDTAWSKQIVTESKASDFPSPLRQKLSSVQAVEKDSVQTEAMTKATCPKCGRTEVRFSTAQLRSADEGTTVFYRCECGFRWNDNN